MRVSRMILLVFISVCTLSILTGMAVAGEYVAKQGDTWAKVAKATGNKVDELAKMNKVKDAKGSAPVAAGTKIVFFSKEDLDDEKIFHYHSDTAKILSLVDSGAYQMAFLLNPTKIEQVKEVAGNSLIMPRKSTYFYPKVITGLVFNKIDPHEIIQAP